MRNKKILITGVKGAAGSYMAEYLKENFNYDLYGIARWHGVPQNSNLNHVKIYECDLMDYGSILNCLSEVEPDLIFHFASFANVRKSFDTPLSVLQNNVMSTANLLDAIRFLSKDFSPKMLMCSTSEVYGDVKVGYDSITESYPIQPNNIYAASKTMQDHLGKVYGKAYGLKIVTTRMFTHTNPRRSDLFSSAFAKQIVDIENGKQDVMRHGNLSSIRTMMDIRDAIRAYYLALTIGEVGETYNIGGNLIVSISEFLDMLIKKSTSDIKLVEDESLLRPTDLKYQISNTEKFRSKTGWAEQYDLDETVEFLLNHFRSKND